MTLDTRIYVTGHTDLRELFTHCQSLLAPYDEDHRTPDQQRSKLDHDSIGNTVGQGLPAWLIVSHGGERPYRTTEQAAVHDNYLCNVPGAEDYDPDLPVCAEVEHLPVCWYEVSFDTAYGYRGPGGMRCGDLHAALVADLGKWLDERGVAWSWLNEFTGDVHGGEDRYARLIDLCSGGFEASAWFSTSVLPAIQAHANSR